MNSRDTMSNARRNGNAASTYPRPDEIPNPHGPSVAADLAALRCRGVGHANHLVRTFREVLNDLAIIARTNPIHRDWLARTLAPAIAACATPDADVCVTAMALAYANADARTEPALVKALSTDAPEDWQALFAAIRLERSRGAELEGLGTARLMEGVR